MLSNSLAFLVELPAPTTHCLLCPGNVISMQEHLCLHCVFWLTVATLAAYISDCNLSIHQPRMPGMWNPCRKLLVKQKDGEVNCTWSELQEWKKKKKTHTTFKQALAVLSCRKQPWFSGRKGGVCVQKDVPRFGFYVWTAAKSLRTVFGHWDTGTWKPHVVGTHDERG